MSAVARITGAMPTSANAQSSSSLASNREAEFLDLSPDQQRILKNISNSFVTACPGAGKTRLTGARIAQNIVQNRIFAATSYTNVGADELLAAVRKQRSLELPELCFAGTLHGFFLRYIYYPFGHLVMQCGEAPRVRTVESDETVDFRWCSFNIDDFEVSPKGTLILMRNPPISLGVSREQVTEKLAADVFELKLTEARSGSANAADAMYWCLRVLEESTEARRALAMRFDEIIVDEAQDISALQAACLERILATEILDSLILIGDLDQSIYSFQGAAPKLVAGLAQSGKLQRHDLTENFRSSQVLCDIAARLRGGASSRAAGEAAECSIAPEVVLYTPDGLPHLVGHFHRHLVDRGLDPAKSAVLARRTSTLSRLVNPTGTSASGMPRTLQAALNARREYQTGLTAKSVIDLERSLTDLARFRAKAAPAGRDDGAMRALIVSWLEEMPPPIGPLGQWRTCVEESLIRLWLETFSMDIRQPGGDSLFPLWKRLAEREISTVQGASPKHPGGLHLSTIHGVKGKSLEAVLLVAEECADESAISEAEQWGEWMRRDCSLEEEEARVLFVALTRAEKLLSLAVPQATPSSTLQTLSDVGFHVRGRKP